MSRRAVRWTEPAFRDLRNAHDYVRRHNPEAARRFAGNVRKAVTHLRDHPEMGPVHQDLLPIGRYRYLVVGAFLVIYRLADDNNVIIVLRVWDSRQDPDRLVAE